MPRVHQEACSSILFPSHWPFSIRCSRFACSRS
jgi:hypothetical protein